MERQAIPLKSSFRKTLAIVTAALAAVTAALLMTSAVDIYRTGMLAQSENGVLAGEIYSVQIIQAHFRVIAPVVCAFAASAVLGLVLPVCAPKEREIVKPRRIEKKASVKPKTIAALRIAVAVFAVALIALGIANGGMRDVFVKAKRICMECIGIG